MKRGYVMGGERIRMSVGRLPHGRICMMSSGPQGDVKVYEGDVMDGEDIGLGRSVPKYSRRSIVHPVMRGPYADEGGGEEG